MKKEKNEKEKAEEKDRFIRLYADFENYKKRTAAEKESSYLNATAQTLAEILPVVDNLERAVAATEEVAKEILVGVVVVYHLGLAINGNLDFSASLKKIVYYEDNLTALTDLEVGGVDAVVMDSIVAEYTITASKKALRVVAEPLAKEAYGIGFKKDEAGEKLRQQVWSTLKEMTKDGTVAAISTKWFGSDISVIEE